LISRNFTKRLPLLTLLALSTLCLSARIARADSVVLTDGNASTSPGSATVNLLGTNFSLNYFGEIPPGVTNTIAMNSITAGFGTVTLNGVSSNIFTGSLTFTNSVLTGNVLAYATMDDLFFGNSPLFTVNFVGAGFVTVTPISGVGSSTQFVVAVPEPTTLLLLGTSFAGVIISRRRHSKLSN